MSLSPQLKFSLNSFKQHDLPNLLINIWSYSQCNINNCSIYEHYKKFCIVDAKEKWSGFYHDFDQVINAIETNKWYHNLGKI